MPYKLDHYSIPLPTILYKDMSAVTGVKKKKKTSKDLKQLQDNFVNQPRIKMNTKFESL